MENTRLQNLQQELKLRQEAKKNSLPENGEMHFVLLLILLILLIVSIITWVCYTTYTLGLIDNELSVLQGVSNLNLKKIKDLFRFR